MPRMILIVEDTAALAASIALALTGIDATEPVVFGNARSALQYLSSSGRELAAVISDLNLPDDDGFSLIRQIRSRVGSADVPAILITASENPIAPLGDMLGAPNRILKKPFSMKEVRLVLETLL